MWVFLKARCFLVVMSGAALCNAHPSDLLGNGNVDFDDFAVFALSWLSVSGDAGWNGDCDLSMPADGFVDELDLAVVAEQWLKADAALFFSEYVEGSGYNKALEIYNASGADVNLADCRVNIYYNGNDQAADSIILADVMLASGEVFVICHRNMEPGAADYCDQFDGNLAFNGDDAVELVRGQVTQDVIGQIGHDPGSSWQGGGLSTQNRTLRRNCDVAAGDANGSNEFDPSVEWQGHDQDTFDGLGWHCR